MPKELYLYSPIYDFVAESLISQLEDNISQEVVLRTNTPGGSVKAGYGVCAKVAEHGNVTIKVDGSADSMAVNLMLYAKSVECLDVSSFTLHRAAYPSWYTPTEEEQAYLESMNKKLKAKMLLKIDSEVFKDTTGYTIEEMFDPTQRIDITIDAKQAKKIGLVKKINTLTPAEAEAINRTLIYSDTNNNSTKMTKEELKSKYPQLYAELVNEGITAERDRVGAWAAFVSVDPEAVVSGIKEGKHLTATAMAELSMKQFNKQALDAIKKESPNQVTTTEVEAPEVEAKKKIADFEAEVKASLKL